MAVVQVIQQPAAREGSFARESGKLNRTYSASYLVLSDDAGDDAATILAACPAIGSIHAEDSGATLKSKSAREVEPGPRPVWEVRCEYSNTNYEFPWWPYQPAQISYGWDRREKVVDRDLTGQPCVNTAKDAYDPPLVIEQPLPSKTINVNLLDSDFSPTWLNQFYLAVNSSSYDGWAKGQALVTDISATQQEYTDEDGTDYTYYQVSIKITFNGDEKGWQPYVLSQGYRELVDGQKKTIVIKGREVTSPMPLNSSGRAVTGDDVSSAAYTQYKVYHEVSFSSLNF